MINESQENARDAMKAIRKRLNQNTGKNYTVVMYTLVLLETCVKNCGRHFHTLVAAKDFIQDLVKMIGPKNEPPAVVQDKVLGVSRIIAFDCRMIANSPSLAAHSSLGRDIPKPARPQRSRCHVPGDEEQGHGVPCPRNRVRRTHLYAAQGELLLLMMTLWGFNGIWNPLRRLKEKGGDFYQCGDIVTLGCVGDTPPRRCGHMCC